VVSDLQLVAEAVTAALAGRGFVTHRVDWPRHDPPDRAGRRLARVRPDAALLICELDRSSLIDAARALVQTYDVSWLVMCGIEPGAAWGAVIDAGAAGVVPTTTTLDDLVSRLEALIDHEQLIGAVERQTLVRQWAAARTDREVLQSRITSLTPRERTVLELLYDGIGVAAIAQRFGVAQTTVRSQVRAILRKLEVNSQIAAVGALGALRDGEHSLV
jgi:RNA polymerase sigma factor (sigma-70 family)